MVQTLFNILMPSENVQIFVQNVPFLLKIEHLIANKW